MENKSMGSGLRMQRKVNQATAGVNYALEKGANVKTVPQRGWLSLDLATSGTTALAVTSSQMKSKRGISAHDVADYFLAKCDEDAGDLISNLKLQKLLYYAQGFCLALSNKPLFPQPIEAWTHGPVVPAIYGRFRDYKDLGLPIPADVPQFEPKIRSLIDEVYTVYGQFSAWKLRNMTHEESPWRDTPTGQEISHEKLKAYFETQLV